MLQLKTTSVTVIVRDPSITKNGTDKHINKIPGNPSQYEIQNIAYCGTAYLLGRVLTM